MSHFIEKLIHTPKEKTENSLFNLTNPLRPFPQIYISQRRTSPLSLSLSAKKKKA
jgi:hypothetical protein